MLYPTKKSVFCTSTGTLKEPHTKDSGQKKDRELTDLTEDISKQADCCEGVLLC